MNDFFFFLSTEKETVPDVLPSTASPAFESWSCDEVVSWLSEQVNLGQYADIFRENEIDGAEITSLTSEMLQKDLGISKKSFACNSWLIVEVLTGGKATSILRNSIRSS